MAPPSVTCRRLVGRARRPLRRREGATGGLRQRHVLDLLRPTSGAVGNRTTPEKVYYAEAASSSSSSAGPGRVDADAGTHGRRQRRPTAGSGPWPPPAWPAPAPRSRRGRSARSCSRVNETLPTRTWTLPTLSVRYSTRPPLNSVTALPTSVVTVPVFGLGMSPRGPRTRPSLPTWPIMSGVAMATSKSRNPPSTLATRSSAPTSSAPASRASAAASPGGEDHHPGGPPGAGREAERPPDDLVGLAGVDPEPHGELDRLVELGRGQLLHQVDGLGRRVQLLPVELLQRGPVLLALVHVRFLSVVLVPTPVSRSTAMPIERAVPATWRLADVDVVGVQVGQLHRGDLGDLGVGDRSGLLPPGRRGALLEPGRLADEDRRRRGLEDERERPVLVDGDLDGHDRAPLVLGGGVVLLAELHGLDAVGPEGRAHRGRGRGAPGGELDLHDGEDLLLRGHDGEPPGI